jgi:hypothetical protein
VDRLARRSGDREGAAAARRLAESAPFDEEMARDLRVSDYAALNAHSLIAIWGALETSVEDTVVDILVQRPDSGALIDALGIKRTVLAQPDDDQARFLYIKVERKLHVPADVVETNLAILRHFGLDLTIDSATAMTLREAGAVRNCLVHRGGRIDSRAAREAPSLTPRIGMDGAVTSDSFLRYHTAVGAWAMALMRAGSESIYYPR